MSSSPSKLSGEARRSWLRRQLNEDVEEEVFLAPARRLEDDDVESGCGGWETIACIFGGHETPPVIPRVVDAKPAPPPPEEEEKPRAKSPTRRGSLPQPVQAFVPPPQPPEEEKPPKSPTRRGSLPPKKMPPCNHEKTASSRQLAVAQLIPQRRSVRRQSAPMGSPKKKKDERLSEPRRTESGSSNDGPNTFSRQSESLALTRSRRQQNKETQVAPLREAMKRRSDSEGPSTLRVQIAGATTQTPSRWSRFRDPFKRFSRSTSITLDTPRLPLRFAIRNDRLARRQLTYRTGTSIDTYYDLRERIGKGAFGTVRRCVDRATKEDRAVKTVKRSREQGASGLAGSNIADGRSSTFGSDTGLRQLTSLATNQNLHQLALDEEAAESALEPKKSEPPGQTTEAPTVTSSITMGTSTTTTSATTTPIVETNATLTTLGSGAPTLSSVTASPTINLKKPPHLRVGPITELLSPASNDGIPTTRTRRVGTLQTPQGGGTPRSSDGTMLATLRRASYGVVAARRFGNALSPRRPTSIDIPKTSTSGPLATPKPATEAEIDAALRNEIEILANMHHPYIVNLYDVFDDPRHDQVHIVMQLCRGGELTDRIPDGFNEIDAAVVTTQMLLAIEYLHAQRIVHRDLKPENFMFVNKNRDADLVLIDFGVSTFFKKEKPPDAAIGTIFYTAPEVFEGEYDMRCDVWSIGVILYSVLAKGKLPFGAKGAPPHVVYKKISTKAPPFHDKDGWSDHSVEARRFIERLLTKDFRLRPTATEALKDTWFEHLSVSCLAAYGDDILVLLARFKQMNDLKKLSHQLISKELTQAEIGFLQQQYRLLDTDGDGNITVKELLTAINALDDHGFHSFDDPDHHPNGHHTPNNLQQPPGLPAPPSQTTNSLEHSRHHHHRETTAYPYSPTGLELHRKRHDVNAVLGLGRKGIALNVPVESEEDVVLDIDEFIAATFRHHMPLREEQLRAAFQKFDRKNRGMIYADDLLDFGLTKERAEDVLAAVDTNGDGAISFEEFQKMMECGPDCDLTGVNSAASMSPLTTGGKSITPTQTYDRQLSPMSAGASSAPSSSPRRTSGGKSRTPRLSAHSRIVRYASSKLSRRSRTQSTSSAYSSSGGYTSSGSSTLVHPGAHHPNQTGRPVSSSFASRIL